MNAVVQPGALQASIRFIEAAITFTQSNVSPTRKMNWFVDRVGPEIGPNQVGGTRRKVG